MAPKAVDKNKPSFNLSIASGNENDQEPEPGLHLQWSRLCKTVQIQESHAGLVRGSIAGGSDTTGKNSSNSRPPPTTTSTTKTILSNVSGHATPGQVLALMGPSGSGKTSLLNCLSGRSTYQQGVVAVQGQTVSSTTDRKRLLQSQLAYVQQQDLFFTHLTVRDQLGYSAFLRLPQSWSSARKLAQVQDMLQLLRLTNVADSPISALSGGEQKRVSIGTELLTNPQALILDEPTSGLDSTSAVSLMQLLQEWARRHSKTVITSIHQPSSAVFRSFDRLLLLAQGHVVYFGRPQESLVYLQQQGLPCPDGYNAADHWMDLLVVSDDNTTKDSRFESQFFVSKEAVEQVQTQDNDDANDSTTRVVAVSPPSTSSPCQHLIAAWDQEAVAEQITELQRRVSMKIQEGGRDQEGEGSKFQKYQTSWWTQYRVLVHRAMKNSRSAIFTPINLLKSVALGIISGLLWFQMDYTEATVFDRSSYFFFTMTYWVFDAMFGALMAFPMERDVILKERSSASYHLGAYFLAKTTSEMPTRLVLPFLYMVVSFWMAAVSPRFDLFVFTTLISLLSVVAGEAIGLMIGASIYDMEKAMTVMTVVSLALMLLGGFFVENVPSWLEWGPFLSPFKYSFDASRQLVFDRPVPCDGSGKLEGLCQNGATDGFVSPEDVIDFLSIQGSVGFNVGLLITMGLVPRYLAYWALRSKKQSER